MERERLTITLKKEIVNAIDRMIDGSKIRNRSHAIEYMLSKNLLPEKTKVLILTGGEGVKLRPFTYEMPKALLPIHNKPLLQHTIEFMAQNGFKDIIISVGHLGEKIKNYFKDGSGFGVQITYIDQDKKESGTAQPLLQAKKLIGESPFILWYGDVLAEADLFDMLDFHKSNKNVVTMGITSVEKSSDWGVVTLKGSQIVEFNERPEKDYLISHLINAGIYIINAEIFGNIKNNSKSLELDVLPKLAKEKNLSGYSLEGQWFDVGSLENYEKAVKEWKK
ncbi:MAG: sugar phosphate nucleotidyltransferase [Minisyncoccia bacterium]